MMMWRPTAGLVTLAIMFLPVELLISTMLSKWLFWGILLLFLAWVANAIRQARREAPARKARIAAILASKPTYVAYESSTPRWLAIPIYVLFTAAGLALMFLQAFTQPGRLTGFNGFLTLMIMSSTLPLAIIGATATFKRLAWHLRSRFPDRLLVFANDKGIGTSNGWGIPYTQIRRIDPCSRRSKFGHDDWIEIADGFGPRRVSVNMSLDPPDEILKQLRDRALAAGGDLAPALPNGRPPSGDSQLGYERGY